MTPGRATTVDGMPPTAKPSRPSWWLAEALAAEGGVPECPTLEGEAEADVAIVGGGYTGLWTALALKERRPDLDVVLVEAEICGAGASGMNGGKVHGYWTSLANMTALFGGDGALAVARAGTRALDGLREFARDCGRDLWWREAPSLRVSASPAQDGKLAGYVAIAAKLGVPDQVTALSPDEVRSVCKSPVMRGGVRFAEGATVHPGRLARALRAAALARGVRIHERTRMLGFDAGTPNRVRVERGRIRAREVVLATNVALIGQPELRAHVTVFSSYAVITERAPERVAAVWPGEEGISDLRMFVHYFRKTPDGRVLMGSGSGPILRGDRLEDPAMAFDAASVARAEAGLRRLLPALAEVPIAASWGGAIDVASDRLPFFGTLPGTRIHYACGYSGHGVNPTHIGGQCLASLVLGSSDEWSTLPLCTRARPRLPPEPFRWIGGNAIRWGIMACETAEELGREGPPPARLLASLPRALGMRVGIR